VGGGSGALGGVENGGLASKSWDAQLADPPLGTSAVAVVFSEVFTCSIALRESDAGGTSLSASVSFSSESI
jgi:hypothetical protein